MNPQILKVPNSYLLHLIALTPAPMLLLFVVHAVHWSELGLFLVCLWNIVILVLAFLGRLETSHL
jgi:hypothetical protein